MNLQELADLPYAGMAEKELKKAGKWDEHAGLIEQEYTFTFTLHEEDERTVSARSYNEAVEKVHECMYDGEKAIDLKLRKVS